MSVTVIDHPLVQHKLTLLRRKEVSTGEFRQLLREISPLLLYEATRDLPMTMREVETPLKTFQSPVLGGKKLCFVPILRAGLGRLAGLEGFPRYLGAALPQRLDRPAQRRGDASAWSDGAGSGRRLGIDSGDGAEGVRTSAQNRPHGHHWPVSARDRAAGR